MKITTKHLKKGAAALLLILSGTTISYAQCEKPVTFKSSVTNHLNDKGEIERATDEETTVTISKTEVTISPGDHTMSGPVTDYVCNWTVPFKEGKTSFKAVVSNGNRDLHIGITIEGKAGKVVLTFTADEEPGKKIQVVADKFE